MGTTKSAKFTHEQNHKAILFKALGHPARVAIVEHLLSVNTCICNDLVGVLPLSQATISQHLRELKECGIIQGTIEGNSLCYCLNIKILSEIKDIIDTFLRENPQNNPTCC